MNQEQFNEVDNFLTSKLLAPDAALEHALKASAEAGLPAINVAPNQGKFLSLLAKNSGAKNILEIGTLGGYSTIWLARALPAGGKLITLEAVPKHAEVARQNLARAGLSDVVEVRLAPALDTLAQLVAEKRGPFDFIFIDADKENYPGYFQLALKLSRVGTCIIADNVVRQGGITDPHHADPRVQAMRQFLDLLAAEPRVAATAVQTVGTKGYDGFAIALVTG